MTPWSLASATSNMVMPLTDMGKTIRKAGEEIGSLLLI